MGTFSRAPRRTARLATMSGLDWKARDSAAARLPTPSDGVARCAAGRRSTAAAMSTAMPAHATEAMATAQDLDIDTTHHSRSTAGTRLRWEPPS